MNHDFAYLSSHQIRTDVPLFVPVGAVEAHGPTLPIGTDTLIAMAFAHRFAQKVQGLVLPPVFVGVCPNTNRFRGSMHVTHASFVAYVRDLCVSLMLQGFRAIVLVNIHNGNDAALKVVVEEIFIEFSHPVYYINPYVCRSSQLDRSLLNGLDNSHKEATLLAAALEVLGLSEVGLGLPSVEADQLVERPAELEILRRYGTVGFAYTEEAQHIAARKSVDVLTGLKYIEGVTELVPELISNLDTHIKRCRSLKEGV
ncbi:MAG: creatininase family protein [Anaerolineae bacterium]|nr:creatininase family protein [Anaerolineae bacterium]